MNTNNILIIGAGRSSSVLISYMLNHAKELHASVTVADADLELAQQKINKHAAGKALQLDITNATALAKAIKNSTIVVSMLPAHLHTSVAINCLQLKKNLITASYISPEMKALNDDVKKAGLLFINECGLDPGIDHMSAMKIIDHLHAQKATITSFKSYCGGLVAPQCNDNPWGYKFSWNPRNVILAGQATAKYLLNGKVKYINYTNLFAEAEQLNIKKLGNFDVYANRDSLSYIVPYGLTKAQTVVRGTMREKNYCKAWNVLVQLGLTDDSFVIEEANKMRVVDFTQSFLRDITLANFIKKCGHNSTSQVSKMIAWLDLESTAKLKTTKGTPAQILQSLLEVKWKLNKTDLDRIVMHHAFEYTLKGKKYNLQSSLARIGTNQIHTAMAETVGLPLAIATKLCLQGKFGKTTGVHMPTIPVLYNPILAELNEVFGMEFTETVSEIV
ncbi:MAG: saccharopine dehydrogenase NADP-binding domain-containing protein [Bacteroidia bacterium]|nr:saccharopine dehydrogenase NADP-binding domain-containing protein [Bacteroidia bacterium]